MGSLERFLQTWLEKKEEGKREWLKLEGWSNKGRRGTGGEEKKGDPTPSNFSAMVAPMVRTGRKDCLSANVGIVAHGG